MGIRVTVNTSGSKKIPAHLKAVQQHYIKALDKSSKRIAVLGVQKAKQYLTDAGAIKSGAARRSIGWQIAKGKYWWIITIGGFMKYLAYLEFGTKPHIIRPKNAKALAFPARKIAVNGKKLTLGSRIKKQTASGRTKSVRLEFYKFVRHPGTKAIRFFTRAMDVVAIATPQIINDEIMKPPKIK